MDRIEVIIPIIKQAGSILVKYRNNGYQTQTKSHAQDFVTTADTETDTYLRKEITSLFPDDKILSEENGNVPDDYMGRVWMIDPLDGTKAFVEGSDSFSVMIGLTIDGIPTLGIMYAPLRDELYYAVKGSGAYLRKGDEEKRIMVSSISFLTDARSVSDEKHTSRELDGYVDQLQLKMVAIEGTNTLKIGKIAQGMADVVINTDTDVSKWDFCAPQAILEEAGGRVTDSDGNPIDYLKSGTLLNKSFIATNGFLHEQVLNTLKEKISGIT